MSNKCRTSNFRNRQLFDSNNCHSTNWGVIAGLKVWYNFAREQGDPEWGDDPPPNDELRWGTKLVKIVRAAEEAL